jgi:LuxR family glucitol operon transcriptional activator
MPPFSLALSDDVRKLLYATWVKRHAAANNLESNYPWSKPDSEGSFYSELDAVVKQFMEEYTLEDEDFVAAVVTNWDLLLTPTVIKTLKDIAVTTDLTAALRLLEPLQFDDVLPKRVNRQRVNRATTQLLTHIIHQLWSSHTKDIFKLPPYPLAPTSSTGKVDELTALVDPYTPYERGLNLLLATISGRPVLRQAGVLQARLLENIAKARQYGDSPDLKNDRLATIDSLNLLTLEELGRSFPDLCGITSQPESSGIVANPTRLIAHNLPQPWYGEFIGRRSELSEIWKVLRPYPASRYHVITIDGVGGVGKTSIALEAAYKYVREHAFIPEVERFDAVVWASAKRDVLTPEGIVSSEPHLRNIDDIYNALADVLRASEIRAGSFDQGTLSRKLLATSRVLIVIDNLETVDDPKVMTFLKELPEPSKAIVTSRHRSIDGAIQIRVGGLGEADGLALVIEEARKKQTPISIADASQIADRTEGVPLAIVWTVGQIALGHSVDQVVKRLGSASGDYAEFVFRDALEFLRHEKKVAAVRLLMGLSLFPDGGSRTAVGYVGGFESAHDIRDEALADLVKLSLINLENGRFSMLALTREYATAEIARHTEFREQATERWFKWHLDLTERAGGGKLDLDASLLAQLNEEHVNLLWVVKSSFTHERFDVFVRLLRGLGFYWIGRGYWREYEENYEKGRLLAPQPEDRIHFATRLIWLNILRRNSTQAEKMLAYANELLADYPNKYEAMRVEDYTGELNMELGRTDKAEAHLRRSFELATEVGDRRGQFAALKYLGELYCRRGNSSYARELLKEAEPFASGTSEDKWIRGLAHASQLRGMIGLVEGNWTEAMTGFNSCLDYLGIWPDERLATRAWHGLAFAKYKLGEIDAAKELLLKAQSTYAKLGMQHFTVSEICDRWTNNGLQGFWETM